LENQKAQHNPLAPVEDDIRQYIRRCLELDKEYKDYITKTEADTGKILLSFIEVMDAFDKVMAKIAQETDSMPNETTWINEFKKVQKKFKIALKKGGLKPVKIKSGTKIKPSRHMVVQEVKRRGLEDGTIIGVIRTGYLWNGSLLRAATVKTVKNNRQEG